MTYAVIQVQGKQFIVEEGDELVVDRMESKAQEKITIPDVLLIKNEKQTLIGNPTVAKASVTALVKDHHKGEKIRVAKYKSKSRYRKVRGHRQLQTTLIVEKIDYKA